LGWVSRLVGWVGLKKLDPRTTLTATKVRISPDITDRTQSQTLLQTKDSDSDSTALLETY